MMAPRISMVTLGVTDLQKSTAFYELLGWQKSAASQPGISFFKLNGLILGLYPKQALAEDAGVPANGTGFSDISFSYNTKSEKEVEEIIARLTQQGVKIVKPPQKVFWGGYSSYFEDPDGYLFEVAYNPYWGFDEQDNVTF